MLLSYQLSDNSLKLRKNFYQSKQGTHEAFRFAVREMDDLFHYQHNQNGLIAVIKLTAALFFAYVPPVFFKIAR